MPTLYTKTLNNLRALRFQSRMPNFYGSASLWQAVRGEPGHACIRVSRLDFFNVPHSRWIFCLFFTTDITRTLQRPSLAVSIETVFAYEHWSTNSQIFDLLARHSVLDSFLDIPLTSIWMLSFIVVCFYDEHVISFFVLAIVVYLHSSQASYNLSLFWKSLRMKKESRMQQLCKCLAMSR